MEISKQDINNVRYLLKSAYSEANRIDEDYLSLKIWEALDYLDNLECPKKGNPNYMNYDWYLDAPV
jgi:hypothetical protein